MKPLTILFLSAFIVSCQTTREEIQPSELMTQQSQLVVHCFISPQDTVLTAKVTRSRPILDNDPLKGVEITDALVVLANGSQAVTLPYDPRLRYYRVKTGKIKITPGSSYTLTVQTPDGKQVSAVSTVPMPVALKTVRLDSVLTTDGDKMLRKKFSVICYWQAPGTAANFYQVQGSIQGIQRDLPTTSSYTYLSDVYFNMTDNKSGLLRNDAATDLLTASAYLGDETAVATVQKRYRSVAVAISLLHVDEAYYRYHEALDRQLQASANPFAEPVTIPGNIQGGLGCFGSYNRSSMMIKMRSNP